MLRTIPMKTRNFQNDKDVFKDANNECVLFLDFSKCVMNLISDNFSPATSVLVKFFKNPINFWIP